MVPPTRRDEAALARYNTPMGMVLAIDHGTTNCRASLVSAEGLIVATASRDVPRSTPRPGWVEQDAAALWAIQRTVIAEALALAEAAGERVVSVGITNQRETTIVWDRATGDPIAPAIVWQDRRTADACRSLRERGLEADVRARTGLLLDPYFSATKLSWILDNVRGARPRAQRGELAFGTVDTWLVWQLTGGRVHATDPSNASRTMLCGLEPAAWDDTLLDLFDVPRPMLPQIRDSDGHFGDVETVPALRGVPIGGVLGDQQAATLGQLCHTRGMAKCTFGTGCFLLMHTGETPARSAHRLISTVAWKRRGRPTEYALEGSVFVAGAALRWLCDGLGIAGDPAELDALAASVPDAGGVVFVPALAGLGAPRWDADARGVICGLTEGTTRAHLARAALEGVALSVRDLVDAMRADAEAPITTLRVDGGLSRSDLLMQIQADVLGIPVVRPQQPETTTLGAAYIAGLHAGLWRSLDDLGAAWREGRRFEPAASDARRESLALAWQGALARTLSTQA